MKVFIITMEDPVYTLPFLKEVISERRDAIIGIATAKGDRLKIGQKRSKMVYLISLLFIMGLPYFLKHSYITLCFKLKKNLAQYNLVKSPSILTFAKDLNIPTYELGSPNEKEFVNHLKSLEPDIIIHQSQNIVKSELLSAARIGMLNRHNAVLPKNRGRLTPFWVLYKGDKETGVSIHFVEKGLDSGPIVIQERFKVEASDTFNSIVRKNYQIAPKAMIKALDKLEAGRTDFIENPDEEATYNSIPTLLDAIRFRLGFKLRG